MVTIELYFHLTTNIIKQKWESKDDLKNPMNQKYLHSQTSGTHRSSAVTGGAGSVNTRVLEAVAQSSNVISSQMVIKRTSPK